MTVTETSLGVAPPSREERIFRVVEGRPEIAPEVERQPRHAAAAAALRAAAAAAVIDKAPVPSGRVKVRRLHFVDDGGEVGGVLGRRGVVGQRGVLLFLVVAEVVGVLAGVVGEADLEVLGRMCNWCIGRI